METTNVFTFQELITNVHIVMKANEIEKNLVCLQSQVKQYGFKVILISGKEFEDYCRFKELENNLFDLDNKIKTIKQTLKKLEHLIEQAK